MSGLSRNEKRFRKKVKVKLRPTLKKVETQFLPVIIPFRRIRRIISGIKVLRTIGSLIISAANLGITVYELYNNFIKDFLEKRNAMTSG